MNAESESTFEFPWDVPSTKWRVQARFVGTWRLTELKEYDPDYLDLAGPAMLSIKRDGTGTISFGATESDIDGKMDELDERVFRFSFEGQDEGDIISGRGYCVVSHDSMTGRLFRHLADEFTFRAKRVHTKKEERA